MRRRKSRRAGFDHVLVLARLGEALICGATESTRCGCCPRGG
ncbi:MAG: hypothetical protein ACLS6G_03385 [Christensenellales bacterium]